MLSSKKWHLYLKFNTGRTFEIILTVLIIVALKASQWAGYIRSFSWEAFRTGEDSGQRARLSGLREVPPNRRTTTLSKVGHHILLFSKLRQLEIWVARRSGSSIKNIRVRLCLCYLPPPCCVCPGRARVFQRFSASCWAELLWVLHSCV